MSMMRQIKGLLHHGLSFEEIRRETGVTEYIYTSWTMMDRERQLKKLELENTRLKYSLARVSQEKLMTSITRLEPSLL